MDCCDFADLARRTALPLYKMRPTNVQKNASQRETRNVLPKPFWKVQLFAGWIGAHEKVLVRTRLIDETMEARPGCPARPLGVDADGDA